MQETKLDGESLDMISENVSKLKELFPEIVTEDKVNFEKLKEVLGEYVEEDNERYNFTWKGKSASLRLAQTPSTGTLRPCKEESKNWDTTENLYIEGDNLEVLKLLQKSYYGKIKMIYIDPPYNTGNDFVYFDNYQDSLQNYWKLTQQIDENGFRTSTNSDTDGRYHTKWVNMIYPRLRLARNLLKNEGVIFVSVDDNEFANLKKIMDEIFGEENFIDCIIWKKRYGGGSKEKYLVTLHEYVLFYAKNIYAVDPIYVPYEKSSIQKYYKLKDENYDKRGPYRTHPLEAGKAMGERKNLIFPIMAPDGTEIHPKRQWLWSKERVNKALENGELEFTKSKTGWKINTKQYLKDENGNIRKSKSFSIIDDVYSQHGTNEIIDMFGNARIFPYPKPTGFMKKLINVGLKEGIILDFFSGSAATADAVMQLNFEDNNNSRKFIMIQLPELTTEKDDSFKAGYKNICEIGKERIRRAGDKLVSELQNDGQMSFDGKKTSDLDIGFKVFKLDSSNLQKWDPDYENLEQTLLDSVENLVPGRSELDLVYEVMLKYGIDLTLPVEEFTVQDKKVYSIGFGALLICLEDKITANMASEIIKLKEDLAPEVMRVVFRDNGFVSDSDKTNFKETLKTNGIVEFITI